VILAHVAGIPIEETALSFGPVLAAGGGIATLRLRERLARRRPRRRPAGPPRSTGSTPLSRQAIPMSESDN
jgi:predicted alpha/beta-hydrolase family hydrolase